LIADKAYDNATSSSACLPGFRRIATRYDKLARNFLAGVLLAAIAVRWLN